MKRVAKREHPPVVTIPDVLGVGIVAVQPPTVLIVVDVEHVRVAVRVSYV